MSQQINKGEGEVFTFGCRLNIYESERIKRLLKENDVENVCVINTCGVTQEPAKKGQQLIRKIKRENKNARIIVTGCGVEIKQSDYSKMPEVDLIVGNALKTDDDFFKTLNTKLNDSARLNKEAKLKKELNPTGEKTNVKKPAAKDVIQTEVCESNIIIPPISLKTENRKILTHFEDRTRAFVEVQSGCDHACTFCVIPIGRGGSRCVAPKDVINEVKALVDNGYAEVILTGVDMTDYGKGLDEKTNLGKLCESILNEVPSLQRLRLSSIDVAEVDETLMNLIIEHEKMMPHIHISLQSGDNMILKRMKRRHTREDVIDFANKARAKRHITLGSDIIVGFPTETDEMFNNSLKLIEEADIIWNHIFTYSSRDGTPASRMPQVPMKTRKERNKIITQQTKSQVNDFLQSLIGTTQNVVIEYGNCAKAESFASVIIAENDETLKLPNQSNGQTAEIEYTQKNTAHLQGKVMQAKCVGVSKGSAVAIFV